MSDTNHWATDAPTPPAARDFDRVDYSHDWWHAQLGDDCFCKQPPSEESSGAWRNGSVPDF